MILLPDLQQNDNKGTSDSATDDNWKGESKTNKDIKHGKFEGNKITKSGINKMSNPNLMY